MVEQLASIEEYVSVLPHNDAKLVYVVDDELMIGEVVQIVLKMDGFKPRFFSNPATAWNALIEVDPKPALLLTDFLMYPFDGMELIQRCKAHYPHLKTILYSGNAAEDVVLKYEFRPDAFLRKPFLPRALQALVRSVLSA